MVSKVNLQDPNLIEDVLEEEKGVKLGLKVPQLTEAGDFKLILTPKASNKDMEIFLTCVVIFVIRFLLK